MKPNGFNSYCNASEAVLTTECLELLRQNFTVLFTPSNVTNTVKSPVFELVGPQQNTQ